VNGYQIARHGGPEVLEWKQIPDPVPGPGQVQVRVRACGLNHLDLWVRNGVPGHRFPLPLVPGSEVSGDVAAVGDGVDGITPGDPVVLGSGVSCGECPRCLADQDWLCPSYGLLGEHRDGGMAELVTVPRRNVLALPRGMSYVEAAATPLVFLTAWHMLAARAELAGGEDVLLHAAGSGVTTAGIQIAKLLGARRIIASSSSPDKLERALELGATHGVDSTDPEMPRRVRGLTDGRGVDVVFDHVGGELFERSFKCLAWGGRIVICGSTAGATAELPMRAVFFKSLSVLGSTMGSMAELGHLQPWFENGTLRPVVAGTLPFSGLAEAHRRLEARGIFGKLVMTADDGATSIPRPREHAS